MHTKVSMLHNMNSFSLKLTISRAKQYWLRVSTCAYRLLCPHVSAIGASFHSIFPHDFPRSLLQLVMDRSTINPAH